MTIDPNAFFGLAVALLVLGILGVLLRRNLLVTYLSIEMMLGAINLILATFARLRGEEGGAVIALLMIGVIAAEAALFLAIIVQIYRTQKSLDADTFTELGEGKML